MVGFDLLYKIILAWIFIRDLHAHRIKYQKGLKKKQSALPPTPPHPATRPTISCPQRHFQLFKLFLWYSPSSLWCPLDILASGIISCLPPKQEESLTLFHSPSSHSPFSHPPKHSYNFAWITIQCLYYYNYLNANHSFAMSYIIITFSCITFCFYWS